MRNFFSYIIPIFVSAMFLQATQASDKYALSLLDTYVQRGVIKIWGTEFPVSVYVKKTSDGGHAMALDSGAGVLIKAKFTPQARSSEVIVSDIMGSRKEAAAKITAEVFRVCLGLFDYVDTRVLRTKSIDGNPQFVETDSLKVFFSDYKSFGTAHLPQTISVESGFMTINLFLSDLKK